MAATYACCMPSACPFQSTLLTHPPSPIVCLFVCVCVFTSIEQPNAAITVYRLPNIVNPSALAVCPISGSVAVAVGTTIRCVTQVGGAARVPARECPGDPDPDHVDVSAASG